MNATIAAYEHATDHRGDRARDIDAANVGSDQRAFHTKIRRNHGCNAREHHGGSRGNHVDAHGGG